MNYLEKAKAHIKEDTRYSKLLSWERKGPVTKIPNCINSYEAWKTLTAFSKEVSIDKDKLLSLTYLIMSIVPVVNSPKAIAEYAVDFDGVYDFQLIIDDYVKVLKNKKPSSRPKNAEPVKYVPEYKETKISYIFGLEYNPKTSLWRLRCKLYPQKGWWGFRFEEKYRSFDDLLEFVVRDLVQYYQDDQEEISIPDDPEEDEDIPTSEEDL